MYGALLQRWHVYGFMPPRRNRGEQRPRSNAPVSTWIRLLWRSMEGVVYREAHGAALGA
jgi:hypothetical protein